MRVLENIKPERVFYYFEEICSVPHGSGNTKIISDKLAGMASGLGLEYKQDELNNLIIKKPASKGYEKAKPVILQGHMDMVCTKEDGIVKDMTKEGIEPIIDGEWVRAKGTSLGGDDGIAVAIAFAILEDDTIEHPPIEVIITVDEEVGMDGAFGIDLSEIKGKRLLNLDSEDEGVFTVSCAGGLRTDCLLSADKETVSGMILYKLEVDGLIGGHSGCEIHKGRANANKTMARVLFEALKSVPSLRLADIKGGQFDNVICPYCEATVAVISADKDKLINAVSEIDAVLKAEYASSDKDICVKISKIEDKEFAAFKHEDTNRIVRTMFVLPQSVVEMSMDIAGLVQTSLNLGVVKTTDEGVSFSYSIRSSIESQKMMLYDQIKAVVEAAGGSVSYRGVYPGWAYNRESEFRNKLVDTYKKLFNKEPQITAIHAGLECGLFIEKIPGLDCVSIGPDLKDIHSCAERLSIASVQRLYNLVVEFLKTLTD